MKQISHPTHIEHYYKNADVVERYIKKRFTDPLNRVEHKYQVALLNQMIHDSGAASVLEFAPGPARVTAELEVEGGVSVDSSIPMLALARNRMKQRGKKWRFVHSNIFDLDKKKLGTASFDLLFSFRFFLHFHREKREALYHQAARLLARHGILVFEALNARVAKPVRFLIGRQKYVVYDKLYSRHELITEVEQNGFSVLALHPVLSHFWIQVALSRPLLFLRLPRAAEKSVRFFERFPSKQPYEWIVVCKKK